MTILITGAEGQLGQALVARLSAAGTVHAFNRGALDITDHQAVARACADARPDLILNPAAFTDVDGAETRAREALAVNGVAAGILARAARAHDAAFVHYSTDFVFAGRDARDWTEEDAPEPQSVYGQSKLLGEWLARDCPRHYVLRVESLFGGPRRRSTIDRIVDTLRAGREARLFRDRTVTPSFVDDVVEATWALVSRQAAPGVYHCVNSGSTTWLGIGREVAAQLGLDPQALVPVSVADVKMAAPRPQYAALSNRKLVAAGAVMPAWEDALRRYLARLPA
jgi:dTDP-4-dehydrorhamnose reductase